MVRRSQVSKVSGRRNPWAHHHGLKMTCVTLNSLGHLCRAIDTYVYHGGSLLECPIFSFGGESCDENESLEGWGMETTSKNNSTLYPGKCLYFLNPDNEVSTTRTTRQYVPANVRHSSG